MKVDEVDPQEPQITGRYESPIEDPMAPPEVAWLLFINKAGSHIEGLLVEVRDGRSMKGRRSSSREEARFSGDLRPDGAFAIRETNGSAEGHLSVVQDKLLLNISLLGLPELCSFLPRKGERRPTLLGAAIFDVEERFKRAPTEYRKLLKLSELRPLHTAQLVRLAAEVDLPKLDLILEKALFGKKNDENLFDRVIRGLGSHSGSVTKSEKTNGAREIDAHIAAILTSKPDSPGWHVSDHPLLCHMMRLLLVQQRSTHGGVTKSYLQWIEDLVAVARSEHSARDDLNSISKNLGIDTGKGSAQPHQYKLELSFDSPEKQLGNNPLLKEALRRLFDAARKKVKRGLPSTLDVDCALGTVTIELATGGSWKGWRQTYATVLVGCGFGKKVQGTADGKFTTSFSTAEEWTPPDFVGFFSILDAGAWGAVKPSDFLNLSPGYRNLGKQRDAKEIAGGKDQVQGRVGPRKAPQKGPRQAY